MSHTIEVLSNKVDKQQKRILNLENKLQQAYNLRDKQTDHIISLNKTIDSEISKVCSALVKEDSSVESVLNLESVILKCLLSKFNISEKLA
jgi:hypothetical protein